MSSSTWPFKAGMVQCLKSALYSSQLSSLNKPQWNEITCVIIPAPDRRLITYARDMHVYRWMMLFEAIIKIVHGVLSPQASIAWTPSMLSAVQAPRLRSCNSAWTISLQKLEWKRRRRGESAGRTEKKIRFKKKLWCKALMHSLLETHLEIE